MIKRKIAAVIGVALITGGSLTATLAQDAKKKDRTVQQYTCKDLMRENGANRDVAIAFLQGFLLGKSGGEAFNLDVLHRQSSEFIEDCLDNPHEKAVDVMSKVKR
jgi:hypothetical protein